MTFIDLSHPINNQTPVYPGTPAVIISDFAEISKDGFREKQITFPSHTATHVDAPAHMLPEGRTLDQLELSAFCGSAVVLDVRQPAASALGQDLLNGLPEVDFILFRTGQSGLWGQEAYFSDYPFPGRQLAERLSRLPIKGVGIDAISIDKADSSDYSVHHILLQKEILIFENLTNLHLLPGTIFRYFAVPLPIAQADGSPVRAFAMVEGEDG